MKFLRRIFDSFRRGPGEFPVHHPQLFLVLQTLLNGLFIAITGVLAYSPIRETTLVGKVAHDFKTSLEENPQFFILFIVSPLIVGTLLDIWLFFANKNAAENNEVIPPNSPIYSLATSIDGLIHIKIRRYHDLLREIEKGKISLDEKRILPTLLQTENQIESIVDKFWFFLCDLEPGKKFVLVLASVNDERISCGEEDIFVFRPMYPICSKSTIENEGSFANCIAKSHHLISIDNLEEFFIASNNPNEKEKISLDKKKDDAKLSFYAARNINEYRGSIIGIPIMTNYNGHRQISYVLTIMSEQPNHLTPKWWNSKISKNWDAFELRLQMEHLLKGIKNHVETKP